jgi:hypothetical protein
MKRARRRYGRAGRKQAFHYVARVKGSTPTRFFHSGSGPISNSAAHAFAGWAHSDTMTLWPSDRPGVYTAKWFDKFSDQFRETELTILEEARVGHARHPVQMFAAYPTDRNKTREVTSVTRHATAPGVYPDLFAEIERANRRRR